MQADRQISVSFMSGPQDGRMLHFSQPIDGEERILTIGRREACDVPLPFDNQASRLHARLGCVSVPATSTDSVDDAQLLSFWLEDMSSRNGTYIDRGTEPIKGRSNLRPGSLFRVGRTWLRLDIPFSYDGNDSW
jgi:pSer/pThr/pTyr-binding forkhead associated (FHA) protein